MKILFSFLAIGLLACATARTDPGGSQSVANANNFSPANPALSLADYLKRVPGLQVLQSGSSYKVTVRGNNSMTGNLEPLFVINGVNVGYGYENAEPLVAVTDIESVQVLKSGQETAAYGMQGTNGVIVIKTKR